MQDKPIDTASPSNLATRFKARDGQIAIIGMGYVGLPLALGFESAGFQVLGVDVDPEKVDKLNAGIPYIHHIGQARLKSLARSKRFRASADFSDLGKSDAILICVPTPLTKARDPDMSYIVATGRSIAAHLRKGQLVSLESTTYPGTTRELLQPILEKGSGLVAGRDFLLAYSPEREDPGNPRFDASSIPKVVGAIDQASLEAASALYEALVPEIVTVADTETAEAVKLTENVFRAVNIALVNELKLIYARMGIDVWDVIAAASTKPFGFMPFFPGPGLGGHCIPIDPFYLSWRARAVGADARFVELAGEINRAMPDHVIAVLSAELGRRARKPLVGSAVLILGMAYKKNVDDTRESPGLVLFDKLRREGASVSYHDPHVAVIPPTRQHAALAGERSVALTPEILASADAVLVVTDHARIDYAMVARHGQLVIDTRNALSPYAATHGDKIVKA